MFSQFLLARQRLLGPAMLAGIGGVVCRESRTWSASVLPGMSQNIGGLLGSAIRHLPDCVRNSTSQLADQITKS